MSPKKTIIEFGVFENESSLTRFGQEKNKTKDVGHIFFRNVLRKDWTV